MSQNKKIDDAIHANQTKQTNINKSSKPKIKSIDDIYVKLNTSNTQKKKKKKQHKSSTPNQKNQKQIKFSNKKNQSKKHHRERSSSLVIAAVKSKQKQENKSDSKQSKPKTQKISKTKDDIGISNSKKKKKQKIPKIPISMTPKTTHSKQSKTFKQARSPRSRSKTSGKTPKKSTQRSSSIPKKVAPPPIQVETETETMAPPSLNLHEDPASPKQFKKAQVRSKSLRNKSAVNYKINEIERKFGGVMTPQSPIRTNVRWSSVKKSGSTSKNDYGEAQQHVEYLKMQKLFRMLKKDLKKLKNDTVALEFNKRRVKKAEDKLARDKRQFDIDARTFTLKRGNKNVGGKKSKYRILEEDKLRKMLYAERKQWSEERKNLRGELMRLECELGSMRKNLHGDLQQMSSLKRDILHGLRGNNSSTITNKNNINIASMQKQNYTRQQKELQRFIRFEKQKAIKDIEMEKKKLQIFARQLRVDHDRLKKQQAAQRNSNTSKWSPRKAHFPAKGYVDMTVKKIYIEPKNRRPFERKGNVINYQPKQVRIVYRDLKKKVVLKTNDWDTRIKKINLKGKELTQLKRRIVALEEKLDKKKNHKASSAKKKRKKKKGKMKNENETTKVQRSRKAKLDTELWSESSDDSMDESGVSEVADPKMKMQKETDESDIVQQASPEFAKALEELDELQSEYIRIQQDMDQTVEELHSDPNRLRFERNQNMKDNEETKEDTFERELRKLEKEMKIFNPTFEKQVTVMENMWTQQAEEAGTLREVIDSLSERLASAQLENDNLNEELRAAKRKQELRQLYMRMAYSDLPQYKDLKSAEEVSVLKNKNNNVIHNRNNEKKKVRFGGNNVYNEVGSASPTSPASPRSISTPTSPISPSDTNTNIFNTTEVMDIDKVNNKYEDLQMMMMKKIMDDEKKGINTINNNNNNNNKQSISKMSKLFSGMFGSKKKKEKENNLSELKVNKFENENKVEFDNENMFISAKPPNKLQQQQRLFLNKNGRKRIPKYDDFMNAVFNDKLGEGGLNEVQSIYNEMSHHTGLIKPVGSMLQKWYVLANHSTTYWVSPTNQELQRYNEEHDEYYDMEEDEKYCDCWLLYDMKRKRMIQEIRWRNRGMMNDPKYITIQSAKDEETPWRDISNAYLEKTEDEQIIEVNKKARYWRILFVGNHGEDTDDAPRFVFYEVQFWGRRHSTMNYSKASMKRKKYGGKFKGREDSISKSKSNTFSKTNTLPKHYYKQYKIGYGDNAKKGKKYYKNNTDASNVISGIEMTGKSKFATLPQ